jgi:hypothetical protein
MRQLSDRPVLILKRALLIFWAIWHTIVLASNVVDAGKALGWLPKEWTFASGNYDLVVKTTSTHHAPAWLNGVLFAGVIPWEAAAALLFWMAFVRYRGRAVEGRSAVTTAFTASLLLWGAFLIADEACIAYTLRVRIWAC